jgi:hypothetical protein
MVKRVPLEKCCEKLTHVHKVVSTWWCWHICKGEEVGEEEEVKPGSECCPRGTAPCCPVHCHTSGGDRLVEAKSKGWSWHHHVVSGGTATPRAVPPRLGREELVLGLAPPVAVCTSPRTAVHHQGVSGATTVATAPF